VEEEKAPLADYAGLLFQDQTKYLRGRIPRGRLDYLEPTALFKEYPSAPAIRLSPGRPEQRTDLWETLARRRSRREFTNAPVTLGQVEALLWAAQGVTARLGPLLLRTAPSAGALYPIETYVYARHAEQIPRGLYHLNVPKWLLEEIVPGDLDDRLAAAALDQLMVAQAALTFLWTAVVLRSARKYGQRAYRYISLDAAHIAAQRALAAEGLGLGCCAIAALYDEEVNGILGLDGRNETILYMSAVGPT